MPLAHHPNVIKAFPANRASDLLGIPVLQRRARRNDHFSDTQRLGLLTRSFSINLVSVPNQIPGRLFVSAGLQ